MLVKIPDSRSMHIQICVNSFIIAEGLAQLIQHNIPQAFVSHQFYENASASPDIVLFDSRRNIDSLKRTYRDVHFICLDLGLSDAELACLLHCHGIHGIISPELDLNMFCKALRKVYQGEIWVEQNHLKAVLHADQSLQHNKELSRLSPQDQAIIQMVITGKTNMEIAQSLCLSVPTVKSHLTRIYKTLNCKNRTSLVALTSERYWSSGQASAEPS